MTHIRGIPVTRLCPPLVLLLGTYFVQAQVQTLAPSSSPSFQPSVNTPDAPALQRISPQDTLRAEERLGAAKIYATINPANMPASSAPTEVAFSFTEEQSEGIFRFAAQPLVDYHNGSFRPSNTLGDHDVKFVLDKSVMFAASGDYLILPAHTVYSLYDLATKKRDLATTNVVERLLGQVGSTGVAIYHWSDESIEFIIFDKYDPKGRRFGNYKGTITFGENVPELRGNVNALIAGYYWITSAKLAHVPSVRDKLQELAKRVLPQDAVLQYLRAP